jgi:hypothetical protein
MRVGHARAVAVEWVREHATQSPGFIGAYFSGSTVDMRSQTNLPPTSDVDVMLVTASAEPAARLGKFWYRDVLLEVSHLPARQLGSAPRPAYCDNLIRMAGDEYLRGILAREAVDNGPYSPVRQVQWTLQAPVQQWASGYLVNVSPSGSFAKGTANSSGTDIDLFISLHGSRHHFGNFVR